jgi:preprotein translocase subunit YajC
MNSKKSLAAMLALCFCLIFALNAFADEQKYEMQNSDTVRSVLATHAGKEVIVKLTSGGDIQGVVTKVGDSMVQISKISTMSYYDAVIRIDSIAAVLLKVRTR